MPVCRHATFILLQFLAIWTLKYPHGLIAKDAMEQPNKHVRCYRKNQKPQTNPMCTGSKGRREYHCADIKTNSGEKEG
jgi:hypothetical protein